MTRYVSFLRAVNVGGRKVEMARVRAAVESLGYENVATYLASGNLFFDAARASKQAVIGKLEEAFRAEFGFEIPVVLRTLAELEAVCALDPFAGIEVTDDVRLLVSFLGGAAPKVTPPATSPKGGYELVHLSRGEAFLVVRLQNGRWPSETWLDDGTATSRFWHTTAKILAAAKKTA